MSRRCDFVGRKPQSGNNVSRNEQDASSLATNQRDPTPTSCRKASASLIDLCDPHHRKELCSTRSSRAPGTASLAWILAIKRLEKAQAAAA